MKIIKIFNRTSKNLGIIFIHGGGSDAGEYIRFVDDFRKKGSLFFLNITSLSNFDIKDFRKELEDFKDQMPLFDEIDSLIIVSHSLGSYFAYLLSREIRKKNKNLFNLYISPAWLINFQKFNNLHLENLGSMHANQTNFDYIHDKLRRNQKKIIENFLTNKNNYILLGSKDLIPFNDIDSDRQVILSVGHNPHLEQYSFVKEFLENISNSFFKNINSSSL